MTPNHKLSQSRDPVSAYVIIERYLSNLWVSGGRGHNLFVCEFVCVPVYAILSWQVTNSLYSIQQLEDTFEEYKMCLI